MDEYENQLLKEIKRLEEKNRMLELELHDLKVTLISIADAILESKKAEILESNG